MRPRVSDLLERERFDRMVLQSALDGHHLPPFVPLEPSDLGASVAALDVVPVVLDAIREAHGLDAWTDDLFERVFLRQAMRAWHGGDLETERRGDRVTARSTTCPIAAVATADARVCQLCRALHTVAAQDAFGFRLHGITFPRLITQGDAVCEMQVIASPSATTERPLAAMP